MFKLSIITINYNNLKGLKRTVDSVINQTWKEFEYIIIDGGSTDGSAEYIQRMKEHFNYWVSEPDKGIYNAMNKGIKAAQGEYLLFLNSGDFLLNESVLFQNSNVFGNYDLIIFNLIQYFPETNHTNMYSYPEIITTGHMLNETIGHPSTVINKKLFENIGLYDESLNIVSDWKFFTTAIIKNKATYIRINHAISVFYMDGLSTEKPDLVKQERQKTIKSEFKKEVLKQYIKNFYTNKKHQIYLLILLLDKTLYKYLLYYFSLTIYRQKKNPKQIPIIIISFNQLTYIKQLLEYLFKTGHTNITILDNKSSYQPLLNYYKEVENKVDIFYNDNNDGHLAFWKTIKLKNKIKGFYAVTDPDILPIEECPEDFMTKFLKVLLKNKNVEKVGFSLKIDDIPSYNPNKEIISNWEKQFWKSKTECGNYLATIDTTFALYKPIKLYNNKRFYNAIRTKEPYIARHLGWYVRPTGLDAELKNYYQSANESSSWKTDANGKLIDKKYNS